METVANFIHGECVTGSGQRVQAIFNPATGEQIRQVVMSTAQETEQAIAAAQQAFPAWARHAPLKRARVMFRFKALLEENMERLARLISEEHGKVFSDAVGELTRGLKWWSLPAAFRICKRANTRRTSGPALTATR